MDITRDAAAYFIEYGGEKPTAKRIDKLVKNFPADTILRMARERGYNTVVVPCTYIRQELPTQASKLIIDID